MTKFAAGISRRQIASATVQNGSRLSSHRAGSVHEGRQLFVRLGAYQPSPPMKDKTRDPQIGCPLPISIDSGAFRIGVLSRSRPVLVVCRQRTRPRHALGVTGTERKFNQAGCGVVGRKGGPTEGQRRRHGVHELGASHRARSTHLLRRISLPALAGSGANGSFRPGRHRQRALYS